MLQEAGSLPGTVKRGGQAVDGMKAKVEKHDRRETKNVVVTSSGEELD
jgi:hypothetical protein